MIESDNRVTIHRANLANWLHSSPFDPFDPDDTFYPWNRPRNANADGNDWTRRVPTYRPRLATMCRWCMERTVSTVFYDLYHPDFRHLCHECRIDARMFIQRLAMHRAMTQMQATRTVIEIMDLDNRMLPE